MPLIGVLCRAGGRAGARPTGLCWRFSLPRQYFSLRDALAQTTVPTVTPPLTGLSTPLTSTTTNCMMSCNSAVANCRTTCVLPAPALGTTTATTGNATGSTACLLVCSNTHLACQTTCAAQFPFAIAEFVPAARPSLPAALNPSRTRSELGQTQIK
jgi:hypothetical protein